MESLVWRLISALASNTLYYSPYRGFFKFPHAIAKKKERGMKKGKIWMYGIFKGLQVL
jgi:hypothetical protein